MFLVPHLNEADYPVETAANVNRRITTVLVRILKPSSTKMVAMTRCDIGYVARICVRWTATAECASPDTQ